MLSVILPVRDWPDERIGACTRSFLRLRSTALRELLIVDFGSDHPVKSPVSDNRVRVVRAEADVWSLGEAINVGVLHAKGSVLAKTDADILIGAESGPSLDTAVRAAAKGDVGLVLAQATDLPEGIGVEAALATPSDDLDRSGRLRPRWGQGGLALFSHATWDAIGGFESRFTGWGGEDNDFADRVRRSGRKVRWFDRDEVKIYHVWHPPSFLAKGIAERRIANRNIAKQDQSVFRPLRIVHSAPPAAYREKSLKHPNVVRRSAPLVTVAIATTERANRTRMLKEAIRSYVGQADNDMEIIVADNGSTRDEHAQLCSELEKLSLPVRLHTVYVEKPSIPATRNIITDHAAGRYVCIADDDDIALPNRMADHLACFKQDPKVQGSHGGWIDFDEASGIIATAEGKERTLEVLLFGTGKITAHGCSCYRADVLRRIGYDESLALGSDFDLALRMAKAGIKVAHTHSLVLLRRYHAENVTLTGPSNQVSNGALSRRRLIDSLAPAHRDQLAARAQTADKPVPCGNQMARERIIEMLPSYVGVWRLHFPLSALAGPALAAGLLTEPVDGMAQQEDASPDLAPAELSELERVLGVVDGDIASLASGVDLGLAFVSRPIRGAAKALRAKRRLAGLGIESEITADADLKERQQRGFDWSKLGTPPGTRRLLSAPIDDPILLTENLAGLPPASVLRGMLSVIADGGPKGFRYHLVTAPLDGRERVAAIASAMRGTLPLTFSAVADGGAPCDF